MKVLILKKKKIEKLFKKKQKTKNDLKLILEILDNNNALKKTKIEAIKWSKKAKKKFKKFHKTLLQLYFKNLQIV